MVCKKCIAIALSIALMMMALTGCTSGPQGDGSTSNAIPGLGDRTSMTMVGIAMSGSESEGDDGHVLQQALQAAGFTVELAYADDVGETQEVQVAAMVEDGASVLIIQPQDAEMAASVIRKQDISNITVIAYGQPISGKNIDYYLGANYREMGRQQAQHILTQLNPAEASAPLTVELMTGTDAGSAFALKGAMEILQPYLDDGSVVIPSARSSAEDCTAGDVSTYLNALLSECYAEQELNALLCLGSDQSAAAIDTLMQSYRGSVFPVVTGSGYDEDVGTLIDQHLLSAVTYAPERPLTGRAVDLIASVVFGASIDNEHWLIRPVLLTRDNLKDYLVDGEIVVPETDGDAAMAIA